MAPNGRRRPSLSRSASRRRGTRGRVRRPGAFLVREPLDEPRRIAKRFVRGERTLAEGRAAGGSC